MTAVKEVQPYSVAYDGERPARISAVDAPTINFDQIGPTTSILSNPQERQTSTISEGQTDNDKLEGGITINTNQHD